VLGVIPTPAIAPLACRLAVLFARAWVWLVLAAGGAATAQRVDDDAAAVAGAVRELALRTLATDTSVRPPSTATPARAEVEVGALDPRLRLAPCHRVEPYLPAGTRLWGRTRVGLRCVEGTVRWNVYLPLQVRVWTPSLVAAAALPAGTVLSAADLRIAEVDAAREPAPAVADPALALGRALARPLAAGEALRRTHLRSREWFAAGDTVKLRVAGAGYAIAAEGTALAPGVEGRTVKIRTDGGRVVTAMPVAVRQAEVSL
jgi:flagella basal body P-ring formation protein FlgA